jgi:hypothetical protein
MDGLSLQQTHDVARTVAAELAVALASVPDDGRRAAWQDGLDLVAVLDGLKPICIVGHDTADEAWSTAVRSIAARSGLATLDAAAWDCEDGNGSLPGWYVAASEQRRKRRPLLYLGGGDALREAAALSSKGRVAPAEEALVLGYPPCCAVAHHRRTLALEQLVAELAERSADGDVRRMTRMIETGAAPLPRTDEDWWRYQLATNCDFAPYTSIAMCGACATDQNGQAQDLSRRYRALARRVGYAER